MGAWSMGLQEGQKLLRPQQNGIEWWIWPCNQVPARARNHRRATRARREELQANGTFVAGSAFCLAAYVCAPRADTLSGEQCAPSVAAEAVPLDFVDPVAGGRSLPERANMGCGSGGCS
jgi:hypothetical protein